MDSRSLARLSAIVESSNKWKCPLLSLMFFLSTLIRLPRTDPNFDSPSFLVILLSRGLEVNGGSGANKNLTLEKDPIAVIGKNLTVVWLSKSDKLPNLITFSVEIGGTKPRRQNLWEIKIESKSKPVKYTRIKGLSPPFDVFTGQTEVKHSDKRYELLLINVRSNMNITNYTFVCEVQLDVFNTIERTVKVKLAGMMNFYFKF